MDEENLNSYLAFTIDQSRYSLPIACVDRIVQAAAINPLPKAPDAVLGLVNLKGEILPVLNIRRRFNHPDREMMLSDRFIVVRDSRMTACLPVSGVEGIMAVRDGDVLAPEEILPGSDYIAGVIKTPDGMILIQDIGRLLTFQEKRHLKRVLPAGKSGEKVLS